MKDPRLYENESEYGRSYKSNPPYYHLEPNSKRYLNQIQNGRNLKHSFFDHDSFQNNMTTTSYLSYTWPRENCICPDPQGNYICPDPNCMNYIRSNQNNFEASAHSKMCSNEKNITKEMNENCNCVDLNDKQNKDRDKIDKDDDDCEGNEGANGCTDIMRENQEEDECELPQHQQNVKIDFLRSYVSI